MLKIKGIYNQASSGILAAEHIPVKLLPKYLGLSLTSFVTGNTNKVFNEINLPINYDLIKNKRDKALIALRKGDSTFIKDYRDNIDVLGSRDKRGVIYTSLLLSKGGSPGCDRLFRPSQSGRTCGMGVPAVRQLSSNRRPTAPEGHRRRR